MIYSAGILLNKNADIIIEADEDGNIISCRNESDGSEYANGASTVSVDITTNDGCIIQGPFVYEEEEITAVIPQIELQEAGSVEEEIVIMKSGAVLSVSDSPSSITVTGNATVSDNTIYVTGDCAIDITFGA